MTDPQPLSDVDLLVWAVVLGYRARQQRAGLKYVLMPFPPCPSCGETVHSVNQVDREVGITRTTSLTMQPCGHAHTTTDDDVFPLLRHIDDLMDQVERGDRSTDPNVHGWMVDDIARAARALIAPQEPLDGPESGQEASDGELAGRNGGSGPQAASGGTAHACGNCEGIDPDTCWTNPDRPPEPNPAEENSASWSHLVIDRGRDLLIPWDNCDGLVAGSVWIHRNDVPSLIQQLTEAIGPNAAAATDPQEQP